MFEKFSDLRSEIFQNLWFWYKSKIYTNFGEKSDPDFAKTGVGLERPGRWSAPKAYYKGLSGQKVGGPTNGQKCPSKNGPKKSSFLVDFGKTDPDLWSCTFRARLKKGP